MPPSITEQLLTILDNFETNTPYVEASALISKDGLVIASRLPRGVEEDRVGAMGAAILSISARSGEELERGEMERVLIEGGQGYILIMSAGEEAVLVVLVGKKVKLGLLFFECQRCIDKLTQVL